jgi:hypothetical protein
LFTLSATFSHHVGLAYHGIIGRNKRSIPWGQRLNYNPSLSYYKKNYKHD